MERYGMFRNWRLWFDHKHSACECVTRNQKEPVHWSKRGHLKKRLGLMMTNDLALFLSSTACGAVPVGNWFTWNIRTTLEIRDWLNNQGLFIPDDRRHITFDRHSCSPMARRRRPVGVRGDIALVGYVERGIISTRLNTTSFKRKIIYLDGRLS